MQWNVLHQRQQLRQWGVLRQQLPVVSDFDVGKRLWQYVWHRVRRDVLRRSVLSGRHAELQHHDLDLRMFRYVLWVWIDVLWWGVLSDARHLLR